MGIKYDVMDGKGKTLEFVFHFDAGHGWLQVPIDLVVKLGLAREVSGCSYRHGEWLYLEEDCDASLVVTELKNRGFEIRFVEQNDGDDSPIRNYAQYEAVPEHSQF